VSTVHVVLPGDIDDPASPSGGNAYDRRVCAGLAELGWSVREHAVPGGWPHPTADQRAALAGVLAGLEDGAVALVDGLVGSAVPEVLTAHAPRLRLVVLAHMAFGDATPELREPERAALHAAAAVVTTSEWSRQHLVDAYGLPAGRVRAAPPGVDPAPVTAAAPGRGRLLCVAAVAPHKGHDVLVEALGAVRDLRWGCVCVGSLHRDPGFLAGLRRRVDALGLAGRVHLAGPRTGAGLAAAYAAADLLVLPSRGESYGMVVAEALARGVPVLASAVGGLPEALGHAADGSRPGMLVPPGDPAALAGALRAWLTDHTVGNRLRNSALVRRTTLTGWGVTAKMISDALTTVVTHESAGT
jgi:glycosyltransferase involved in cell wall biosynthesis